MRWKLATYPVVNKKTGEKKEVVMSVLEWEEWKKNNSEWSRDWSDPSTMPGVGEVGEWRDKLENKHPGWKEVLDKTAKSAGSKSQMRR